MLISVFCIQLTRISKWQCEGKWERNRILIASHDLFGFFYFSFSRLSVSFSSVFFLFIFILFVFLFSFYFECVWIFIVIEIGIGLGDCLCYYMLVSLLICCGHWGSGRQSTMNMWECRFAFLFACKNVVVHILTAVLFYHTYILWANRWTRKTQMVSHRKLEAENAESHYGMGP